MLGVPVSTLKSRLQRGRELLRKRLERRGVGLSAVGLVVLLVEQSKAGVTGGLVRTTVEAAVSFATAGTGTVSSQAAALALKALKTTAMGKIKLMAFGVLAFGLLGFGAAAVPRFTVGPALPPGKMSTKLAQKGVTEPVAKDQDADALPTGAIARLGTLRWRHDAFVRFAAFLPGGKSVVTVCQDGAVHVREYPSGKEIRRVEQSASTPPAPANANAESFAGLAALSKDGKTIATVFSGGKIRLHDVGTGKPLPSLGKKSANPPANSVYIMAIAFSPDNSTLAASDNAGIIRLWDLASGKIVREFGGQFDGKGSVKHLLNATLVYAPDGKTLATSYSSSDKGKGAQLRGLQLPGLIKLWDATTGKETLTIQCQTPVAYRSVVFSPDGKVIAYSPTDLSPKDGAITLFEVASGKEIRKLGGHVSAEMFFSDDGTKLYACSSSNIIVEVDVATGKSLRTMGVVEDTRTGPTASHLSYSPEASAIVMANNSLKPLFIDMLSGNRIGIGSGHIKQAVAVRFTLDGKSCLTQAIDSAIKKWDTATYDLLNADNLKMSRSFSSISPDEKVHAMWQALSGNLIFYDEATGAQIGRWPKKSELPKQPSGQNNLCFSPDSKMVALRRTRDEIINLVEVANLKLLHSISIANNEAPGPRDFKMSGNNAQCFSSRLTARCWRRTLVQKRSGCGTPRQAARSHPWLSPLTQRFFAEHSHPMIMV